MTVWLAIGQTFSDLTLTLTLFEYKIVFDVGKLNTCIDLSEALLQAQNISSILV